MMNQLVQVSNSQIYKGKIRVLESYANCVRSLDQDFNQRFPFSLSPRLLLRHVMCQHCKDLLWLSPENRFITVTPVRLSHSFFVFGYRDQFQGADALASAVIQYSSKMLLQGKEFVYFYQLFELLFSFPDDTNRSVGECFD